MSMRQSDVVGAPVIVETRPDGSERMSPGRLIDTGGGQVRADPNGRHSSVHVGRTTRRPTSVQFGAIRPWRWRVTRFELVEGQYPGVFDQHLHLGVDSGWAITKWGAQFAAGRRAEVGGRAR